MCIRDSSSYIGRIAVGRVARGTVKAGQNITLMKRDGKLVKSKIKDLFVFSGLGKIKAEIVTLSLIHISEPTRPY